MPHHYRITVDKLDPLKPGEGGLESVSFFAATSDDILAAANSLRECLGCSASRATTLALGYGLIGEPHALLEATEKRKPRNIS
ncbi:MAG: hypothetical protein WBQ79_09125 [Acidobacteriaceae bacterium]